MTEFHPLRSLNPEFTSLDALDRNAVERAKRGPSADMPCLEHLTRKDYNLVYEPSDDTYLLLDGILLAMNDGCCDNPQDRDQPFTTVEIGCGTGVPTVYLATQLQRRYPQHTHRHYVTDVNHNALRIAQEIAVVNGVGPLHAHACDLATDLVQILKQQVDILLFNPPYVPTPDDEVGTTGIEASWAGGLDGRRVVDRAIPQIHQLLKKPTGIAFLITVDDNKPVEMKAMFARLGLEMIPWVRRKARNEYLSVQRIQWIITDNTT